ncbi:MAG: GAF domain-containing protein [Deltaproteobacteria bacterium]|nr:GAF domain-containing protein [Deltaproteobacteria bacterium]
MTLFQLKSIRSRLFMTMIVAIIGVVTIAAIVWRLSIEPAWRMEVARNQSEVARRVADQIDEFLEHRIAELLMAAEIGRFWEHERNRQKETLYRLFKLDPQVHEVSVADRGGKEILRLSRSRVYTDADLISLEGAEKFLQAIQGKIYISKVYYARTAEPSVTLAVPLKFTATDIRGILSAEIALKTLWQSISHIKIGKSGHAFVVDQKGKLIAHPDYSKVLLGLNMAHLQEVKKFLSHPDKDPDLGEVGVGQDGKRVISTFAVVPRTGWAVVVEEPVGTALAEVKQVERLAILIFVFTLAGAFGLSYWFSERISQPVRKLEEGTKLIAQGNLEHKLEIHTGDEIETLANHFNQMAQALKSSYEGLEAKIAERTKEISALYAALTPLARAGSLTEMPEKVIERLMEVTGADAALIRVRDKATGAFVCASQRGFPAYYLERALTLSPGAVGSALDYVFKRGEPLISANIAVDPRLKGKIQLEVGFQSCAYLPLKVGMEVRGIVHLASRKLGYFKEEMKDHLIAIAHQMGIAMENRELYEETERRNRELQALYTITNTVTRSLDIEYLMQAALMTTIDVLRVDAGRLYVLDEKNRVLRLTAHHGLPVDQLSGIECYAPGEGIIGRTFNESRPIVFADIASDPNYKALARGGKGRGWGFRSAAGLPITVKDRPVGVIYLYGRAVREFTSQDLELLSAIGGQIGVAVENARLFEESQRNLERVRALREIDQAITSTLDARAILDVLLEKIDLCLPYSAVAVWLLNRESGEIQPVACRNLDEEEWNASFRQNQPNLTRVVLESKAPVIVSDFRTDPRVLDPALPCRLGLVSYLGVPLIVKEEILGALSFYTKEEHEFSNEEVEFLSTLAGQAAVAIHNSQLYEEIKNQAGELQKSNRVKDEFLSVMSHELRTPLNVIIGYTGMVKDGMLGEINPEQERALGKVMSRSKELLTMISGIMEATRIEAEEVKVERSEVNVMNFLDELRSGYNIPSGKGLTLHWDYPSDLPVVKTDSEKLKHILQNLINNAVKFTERGSVTISARLRPTGLSPQASATFVEFKVADTGVGIAEEFLPVIFEKFRQVDSSETRPYGGVGMGLYIVKRFTELLSGKVEVESESGKGSTFTVAIPSES